MKTKRLTFEDLKSYHLKRRMVLFQKFDDPAIDMGVIESIQENAISVQTWIISRFLFPLEDYVFYGLEIDDED